MSEAAPTRLIVVRHGESNVTVERNWHGGLHWAEPLGRQQAERLRDRFAAGFEPDIDEVGEPASRAYETAEIVNE